MCAAAIVADCQIAVQLSPLALLAIDYGKSEGRRFLWLKLHSASRRAYRHTGSDNALEIVGSFHSKKLVAVGPLWDWYGSVFVPSWLAVLLRMSDNPTQNSCNPPALPHGV